MDLYSVSSFDIFCRSFQLCDILSLLMVAVIWQSHAQVRSFRQISRMQLSYTIAGVCQAARICFSLVKSFPGFEKFTQLAWQNETRLVARFDWDQRFVAEPPSFQRDLWSIGSPNFWPQGLALNRL